ncbi:ribonuclease III [Rhizorhapis suberifaciens]|uniref:Ribonuclease 3 n=1 Tax=Rhizorhapis suberifaciens TaxID=13656 RepID=A0A840HUH7_9SPHN|nr:ribonuclease III [Rhizorhapis suberifaciens]MBB4641249.1 ribonuclease-3 [Rhizorhapis suberifaciens]
MDLVYRGALQPHRGKLLNRPDSLEWVRGKLGHDPVDLNLFTEALTHGSHGPKNYERLEFLGDRVLGLIMAEWLYEHFADEPEGMLSRRLNALVAGETCAEIARNLALGPNMRLGKQARDDGAIESDNVLGDVMEALIGALYIDGGIDVARSFVRRAWADRVDSQQPAPKHPKSALQEWAAAHRRKPPEYALTGKTGPAHNPRFIVTVSINGVAEATAEGSSKQEAETAAAKKILEELE